jgi:hypothetical protein
VLRPGAIRGWKGSAGNRSSYRCGLLGLTFTQRTCSPARVREYFRLYRMVTIDVRLIWACFLVSCCARSGKGLSAMDSFEFFHPFAHSAPNHTL